ncbi:unnamed protein product [Closterium sp. Yama58-4]|nr:unnamed protein product [Closterium sp. Yama58-4]
MSDNGRPSTEFVTPSSNFGRPSTGFVTPSSNFGRPSTGFVTPSSNFGRPSTGFVTPSSNFGRPSTGFFTPITDFGRRSIEFVTPSSASAGSPAPRPYELDWGEIRTRLDMQKNQIQDTMCLDECKNRVIQAEIGMLEEVGRGMGK